MSHAQRIPPCHGLCEFALFSLGLKVKECANFSLLANFAKSHVKRICLLLETMRKCYVLGLPLDASPAISVCWGPGPLAIETFFLAASEHHEKLLLKLRANEGAFWISKTFVFEQMKKHAGEHLVCNCAHLAVHTQHHACRQPSKLACETRYDCVNLRRNFL